MGIFLSAEFRAPTGAKAPRPDEAAQVNPSTRFHTPGTIPAFILVPLNQEMADITYPDGRNETLVVEMLQTFAIDEDRLPEWCRAGYISWISAENETLPGTADVYTRLGVAQEEVKRRNNNALDSYLSELRKAEVSGARIERSQNDLSAEYEDLAVRQVEQPLRILKPT